MAPNLRHPTSIQLSCCFRGAEAWPRSWCFVVKWAVTPRDHPPASSRCIPHIHSSHSLQQALASSSASEAMALRLIASRAATSLGIRCLAAEVAAPFGCRAFSTGRKYLPSHEWIELDGEIGTVGITDFAQSELGEVVFVDLPEAGTEVSQGKTFGVVESVKAASDVYSPISGEVVEANKELSTNPGLVNTGPFAEGWIMKVKVSNPAELDTLLDDAAYTKRCEESH